MGHLVRRSLCAMLLPMCLAGLSVTAQAADIPYPSPVPIEAPLAVTSPWSYRFIPYGWLVSMNGNQTVRGRTVKVDATFVDIVEKSDTLLALMGNFEARNGALALYADAVWTKIGLDGNTVRTRSLAPGVVGSLGAAADFSTQLAVVEVGAAYQVASAGALKFDILGGVRYWYQEADLSLDLVGTLNLAGLELIGGRAVAKSGAVDWVDPVIGARIRYDLAPGHELFVRGDIGGFGVGSKFSWQAIAGYGMEFGTYQGVTYSGVIGYRALGVDYAQGSGTRRYEFDMVLHGPVVGLSMKF
ncbi:hypothetical protein [Microvirga antarctica]|uniref:hypothetical protein n=1 Tax=Microvirga antarctica TaxID=2819233 RepID=UPI001B306CB3|nr:hypothetical protein [Microvirga antarctica]